MTTKINNVYIDYGLIERLKELKKVHKEFHLLLKLLLLE